MPGWDMKVIAAETQRLLALAATDAGLRAELRSLADEILKATETEVASAPAPAPPPPPAPVPAPASPQTVTMAEAEPPVSVLPETTRVEAPPAKEPLRELTLGRSRSSPVPVLPPAGATARPLLRDAQLPGIEARCRLKAEGARWAAARQRRLREGSEFAAEISPNDPEIAHWADQLVESFFWVGVNNGTGPADIAFLDDLGGCFEAVAGALRLVVESGTGQKARLEQSLPLLAEAQSSLRAATQLLRRPDEPEQTEVFEWLKATAARRQVYIRRYMRASDLADVSRWRDLLDRIEEADARCRKSRGPTPQQTTALGVIRSHLEPIAQGVGTEQHWRQVMEAVDALVKSGVPPSNREIRELLLPVVDALPEQDDLPDGFRLVLREIDRFLATRRPLEDAESAPAPTAEVQEARRLLHGRSAVLIGGDRRRDAQRLLKTALGLAELVWIETREHQSITAFEPAVARPEVSLVLLAIRWTSHSFGDVKQFCDRYGKPLVRLPGGYSPNQVAAQIVAQCSAQLGGG
jgi:hypothetical protein